MRVTVTTTYENLDEKTVNEMISNLERQGWPPIAIGLLRQKGSAKIESKDPESDQYAATRVVVEKYHPDDICLCGPKTDHPECPFHGSAS